MCTRISRSLELDLTQRKDPFGYDKNDLVGVPGSSIVPYPLGADSSRSFRILTKLSKASVSYYGGKRGCSTELSRRT